jgi:hypothetical protein
MTVMDFRAEHDLDRIGANVGEAMAGTPMSFDTVHRHKDGHPVDANSATHPDIGSEAA